MPKRKSKNSSRSKINLFLLFLLFLLIGFGFFFKQGNSKFSLSFPVFKQIDRWQVYTLPDAEFKYSSQWKVVNSATLKDKIGNLVLKCSGPILQNIQNKSILIAVEIMKPNDNKEEYCWSQGNFKKAYERSILNKKITVAQWTSINPFNRGAKENYSSSWSGYLFQSFNFNELFKEDSNKNWYQFALIYENGANTSAEPQFDQILSTFNFKNEDQK